MNDPDLGARLRATYRSRSADAAPPTLARRVLAIPATTQTRRGWLPRLRHGGTRPMFNATKAFAAIAAVALAGGALALSLDDGHGTATPGAGPRMSNAAEIAPGAMESAVMTPRAVSGTITDGEWPDADEESLGDGLYRWTSEPVITTWSATDERMRGTGMLREHGLQHFDTYTGLRSSSWSLETEDGGWFGSGHAFSSADGGRDFLVLNGTGAYDGLSAYIAIEPGVTATDETEMRAFEGVIFPGTMAPPPELPSGE